MPHSETRPDPLTRHAPSMTEVRRLLARYRRTPITPVTPARTEAVRRSGANGTTKPA